MPNPILVLETALLVLAAFLIGATVGTLARVVVLRFAAKTEPQAVAETPPPAASEALPALVTAPLIEPINRPATPTAPAEVPSPDFAEITRSLSAPVIVPEVNLPPLILVTTSERDAAPQMAPARVAGETTSGRLVPSPREPSLTNAQLVETKGESAEVIVFPAVGGAERIGAATEVSAASDTQPEPRQETESVALDPIVEPEPPAVVAPDPAPVVAAQPAGPAEDDEAAAMRAIEGNWTPKRSKPRQRAAASATAGADASSAASQPEAAPTVEIKAAPEPTPGKPQGLEAPRQGKKDNLTNIIGILPIIETALNSLGIFHFDQVADLSSDNVAWIEAHLGIAGRIEREHWREQARELALVSDRSRKVAAQP